MKNTSMAQDNLAKLPAQCFSILQSSDEMIVIEAGMSGYRPLQRQPDYLLLGETMEQLVDKLNKTDGVTKAQRLAMEHGSMFGWETPGANPEIYKEDGSFNRAGYEKALAEKAARAT